jgi:transcriptional regulator GlxA family with amidase domain
MNKIGRNIAMNASSPIEETFNMGIFLYPGVEELDFCGPFEVLKAAAYTRSEREQNPAWEVFTVAEEPGLLKTGGELLIQPHFTFHDHPRIDLLVIPGGMTNLQMERQTVLEWVRKVTSQAQLNTSVCTGAFLLGAVGLLDGYAVTTHWSALDELARMYPEAQVQRDVRWVDVGRLVTAAGISAGIDMSLHLVERLAGRELAQEVARYMEYRWQEQ